MYKGLEMRKYNSFDEFEVYLESGGRYDQKVRRGKINEGFVMFY